MPKYIVRFGATRNLGVFTSKGPGRFGRGTRVVARTNRGLEAADVLCEATEASTAQLADPPQGQILRAMTAEDENELAHLQASEPAEFETCQRQVKELGLQMVLVDLEHLFGGERIVIYYLAEARVDFRELVKTLASEFQTRIEMRQIGVRDEAKLLADYGDCGKEVCCNTHLVAMPPVSMKMAKTQRASLDPNKISGRCGRLKCCLRYEYETYRAAETELPAVGARVRLDDGRARVLSQNMLTRELLVETEDSRRILVTAHEVREILTRSGPAEHQDAAVDTMESP